MSYTAAIGRIARNPQWSGIRTASRPGQLEYPGGGVVSQWTCRSCPCSETVTFTVTVSVTVALCRHPSCVDTPRRAAAVLVATCAAATTLRRWLRKRRLFQRLRLRYSLPSRPTARRILALVAAALALAAAAVALAATAFALAAAAFALAAAALALAGALAAAAVDAAAAATVAPPSAAAVAPGPVVGWLLRYR